MKGRHLMALCVVCDVPSFSSSSAWYELKFSHKKLGFHFSTHLIHPRQPEIFIGGYVTITNNKRRPKTHMGRGEGPTEPLVGGKNFFPEGHARVSASFEIGRALKSFQSCYFPALDGARITLMYMVGTELFTYVQPWKYC